MKKQYIMEGIYNATDDFQFSNLQLLKPATLPGGNYFIKFRINASPLYIQTPKCNTKNGILKAGKKYFTDLLFSNENEQFIQWVEKLEEYSQKSIFEHKNSWFDTELDMHDIENSFASCMKSYKSGKYYTIRTHIPTQLGNCVLKIYNEHEEIVDPNTITDKNEIITILEVQGIKCSARSFQIEMEVKQMLVLKPTNLFEKCILSSNKLKGSSNAISNSFELRSPEVSRSPTASLPEEIFADTKSINTTVNKSENSESNNISSETPYLGEMPYETSSAMVESTMLLSSQYSNDESISNVNSMTNQPISSVEDNSSGVIEISKTSHETSLQNTNENEYESSDIQSTMDVPNSVPITNTTHTHPNNTNYDELEEIDIPLEEIPETEQYQIKTRNDVYYKLYQDAKRKAKLARDLALSSYLEAKQIKNMYMLNDLDESDSDLDDSDFYSKAANESKSNM
jgi:hypothetical protein